MKNNVVFLHIGVHKTGTTSLQNIFHNNPETLKRNGYSFFKGSYIENNHIELAASCLRENVETLIEYRYKNINTSHSELKKAISSHLNKKPQKKFIFSSEMLSFFRTEKECLMLKKLFPENTEFKIMVTLRKKSDFIESYKKQILKHPTRSFSKDKNSALYVEDDSWVFNHEKLIEAYSMVFDEIKIFEYGHLINDEILDYLNIYIDSYNIRKNKSANLLIIKAKRILRKLIDNKF